MLYYKDIIKEENEVLYKKSSNVEFPLSNEDKETLLTMNAYLERGYSEDPDVQDEFIRAGVGLAAPQIGILKRMFVVMAYDEVGTLHHFGLINPKITSHSIELAYLPNGEGCLSVDRTISGLVHRYKRITIDGHYYDFETNKIIHEKRKFTGYLSIVMQHEYDHLDGILFVSKINSQNPFFIPDNSVPITFED